MKGNRKSQAAPGATAPTPRVEHVEGHEAVQTVTEMSVQEIAERGGYEKQGPGCGAGSQKETG